MPGVGGYGAGIERAECVVQFKHEQIPGIQPQRRGRRAVSELIAIVLSAAGAAAIAHEEIQPQFSVAAAQVGRLRNGPSGWGPRARFLSRRRSVQREADQQEAAKK